MRFRQTLVATGAEMGRMSALTIENEPMLFNADRKFLDASQLNCPRAHEFLLLAKAMGYELDESRWSLDTRSHMLMRGWLPAIPGWHHDDVDRGNDGQPRYDLRMPANRRMLCVVVDAFDKPTGSLTEFAASTVVDVCWPTPEDAPVYRYWDQELRVDEALPTTRLESGRVYEFGCDDFHRAVPATSTGWRWFARLTFNPGPRPDGPKVRRQTQVYLPVVNQGW